MSFFIELKTKFLTRWRKAIGSLGDALYFVRCALHKPFERLPKSKKPFSSRKKDLIFYCLLLAYPLAQFLIFYVVVNFNSILLTFQTYDRASDSYLFSGLNNIQFAFQSFIGDSTLVTAFTNSLIVWGIALAAIPLNLLFTFYIYEKRPFYSVFKVVLFIPSIISSIAMVIMFMYFVERAIPAFAGIAFSQSIAGLLSDENTIFPTLVFFNVFFGFGPNMLLFLGAMNKVPKEIIEAAHVDGAVGFREFFSIILPNIYKTVATIIVLSVAGIFAEQYALFSFFGNAANPRFITIGYYLFTKTASASIAEYPVLSAMGVLLTLLAIPLTFFVRYLLNRFDPVGGKEWSND